jgi:hypothetical protein
MLHPILSGIKGLVRPALMLTIMSTFIVACSSEKKADPNQKPVHLVSGKLTVGTKPAVGAYILLIPQNSSDPRPRGTVEADGSFKLSTYGEFDGAPAGDYVVTVSWPAEGREGAADQLKGRYSNPANSKLKVTVKEGNNELPPFEL